MASRALRGVAPCPRCSRAISSSYYKKPFSPQACRDRFGPKHELCADCTQEITSNALQVAQKMNEQPFLKCHFETCQNVWTYNDWMHCGITKAIDAMLKFSLDAGVASMKDVRFCPQCATPGFIESTGCPAAVCVLPTCNFVFCTLCQTRAHKGVCGAPQDEPDMIDKPDKFFNLDILLSLYTNKRGVAFAVKDLLLADECDDLIQAAINAGFESLEKTFPNDYRSNDRLLVRSKSIANTIFERLLRVLTPDDIRATPMGPSGPGLWLPCGVNEVLKIARYRPGCSFKAHRDGPWAPGIDQMSIYTVVIYLNSPQPRTSYYPIRKVTEPFSGGDTRFYEDGDTESPVLSVKPEQGKALIFTQSLMHDGANIASGVKYILRTEIMYRRVKSVLDRSPALLAACDDLKRIGEAYKRSTAGDPKTFLNEYLLAIELQAKPLPQSQRLPVPDDVIVQILLYLPDEDIGSFGRVNKAFYRLSRDNALWRLRMRALYPDVACMGGQDLSIDWHLRYRTEVQQRRLAGMRVTVAAMDMGSALLKSCMVRKKTRVLGAYYTIKVEEYMSHGSRCTTDVINEVPVEMLLPMLKAKHIGKHNGLSCIRAVTDNNVITNKGFEVVRQLSYGHSWNSDKTTLTIAVLPDDWDPKEHLNQYLDFGYSFGGPIRFVSTAAAVAQRHKVKSAVVLMLGHSNRTLAVVENMHVTRVMKIMNDEPRHAKRIAKTIHSVLLSGLAWKEVESVATEAKKLYAQLPANDDTHRKFKAAAKAALDKLEAVNPNIEESARELIGYQLLISGGRVHDMKGWIAELKATLNELSPKWCVSITESPHTDTVEGACTLNPWTEPVFRYGLGVPPPKMSPIT